MQNLQKHSNLPLPQIPVKGRDFVGNLIAQSGGICTSPGLITGDLITLGTFQQSPKETLQNLKFGPLKAPILQSHQAFFNANYG